jgi:hypothetical protein
MREIWRKKNGEATGRERIEPHKKNKKGGRDRRKRRKK